MIELKKNISLLFKDYKVLWIEEFKKAQAENRGIELEHIMLGETDINQKMSLFFIEAEQRIKPGKKKGFFG